MMASFKPKFLNPYWWQFQWRYWRGQTPWDTQMTPPEVMAFLETTPPGKALDLGCGTGTNAITMARSGWQVTGVDFIPSAIRRARRKAAAAGLTIDFIQASVTELDRLGDPFDFILDIGCLFGLNQPDRQQYAAHLVRLTKPGTWYMLYAWLPRIYKGKPRGITERTIDHLLGTSFTKIRVRVGEENNAPSAWYWYQRQ